MSLRTRVLAISGAAVLAACLLAFGRPYVVDLAHVTERGVAERGEVSHGSRSQAVDSPPIHTPPAGRLKTASVTAVAPEAPYAERFGQQFADFENIQVDVHRDGSITVLGQTMAMDDLLAWLRDQRSADIDTCVSVRADGDCQYHQVGRVVQMCQELGVPTLMLPVTASRPPKSVHVRGPA